LAETMADLMVYKLADLMAYSRDLNSVDYLVEMKVCRWVA